MLPEGQKRAIQAIGGTLSWRFLAITNIWRHCWNPFSDKQIEANDVLSHVQCCRSSMQLPTRTTTRTDSRAKAWIGDSVELDAIPANTLRQMVQTAIKRQLPRTTSRRSSRWSVSNGKPWRTSS
jgi:hypothetical protein